MKKGIKFLIFLLIFIILAIFIFVLKFSSEKAEDLLVSHFNRENYIFLSVDNIFHESSMLHLRSSIINESDHSILFNFIKKL